MTVREANAFIGRTGQLSGSGLPWPIQVSVQNVREVYGRIDFYVTPIGESVAPLRVVEDVGVWVESSRVRLGKED